jgi:hypothetical protein
MAERMNFELGHFLQMKLLLLGGALIFLASCLGPANASDELTATPCPLKQIESGSIYLTPLNFEVGSNRLSGMNIESSGWNVVFIDLVAGDSKGFERQVFFFPGGPRQVPIDVGTARTLKQVYEDGMTQITVVAHSGNELPGLTGGERLRKHGIGSSDCDAALIEKAIAYVETVSRHEITIFHANSYGSVVGLDIASRWNGVTGMLVLQAPWLFPLPVTAIVESDASVFLDGAGGPVLSKRSELNSDIEEVYGKYLKIGVDADGKSDGEVQLRRTRSQACERVSLPVVLLIAEFEDRADVEKTIDFSKCFINLREPIIAGRAFHGSELAVQASREALAEELRSLPKPQ